MDEEIEKRIASLEAQIENAVATKDDLESTKLWFLSGIGAFAGAIIIILLSAVIQLFIHFSDKV